jgi:hypothetical protein
MPVLWITVGSVLSGLLISVIGGRANTEIWLGMLAPLVVVCGTWMLIERVHQRNPARVTSLLIGAFAGKLVFFGAYAGLVIGVLRVQPIPFIVSFTSYFIVLHLIEALYLKRLFEVAKRRGA